MTAISERFASLRQRSQCALVPFITAGDPDLDTTVAALKTLDAAGADFIELGVPYSDPLADGPTIQAAATRALAHGTTLTDVLDVVTMVGPSLEAPIILFTYYNPIYAQGAEAFLDRLATAGVKGLVVPDLPLEEADSVLKPAAERGLDVTLLVAPTSPPERIARIAQKSQGFIYLVSVTGVTGARANVSDRVPALLQSMRQATDKPIGVGFGISSAEQARQVKSWGADAAIVGSAIVRRLAEEGLPAVESFCCDLKQALMA